VLNLRNQVMRTDLPTNLEIKLSYRENYLSFDFAALDYTAPAKNRYAYQMEGLDDGWIEAGTRRHADYPDLKPGTYTFRMKASNSLLADWMVSWLGVFDFCGNRSRRGEAALERPGEAQPRPGKPSP
jgi:hypothetical protein